MPVFKDIGVAQDIGYRDTQQDRYVIDPRRGFVGVLDGHGASGEAAAEWAAGRLMGLSALMSPYTNLSDAFKDISSEIGIRGGTTATLVSVSPYYPYDGGRQIVTHNVGDSPAYLVDPSDPLRENGILRLTEHHDVDNPYEASRMLTFGMQVVERYFMDSEKTSGIAISRALGDGDVPGVISDPSRSQWTSSAERLLIVASDGVLTGETTLGAIGTAIRMFKIRKSMADIAQRLVSEFSEQTGDNATAIVAHIPSV